MQTHGLCLSNPHKFATVKTCATVPVIHAAAGLGASVMGGLSSLQKLAEACSKLSVRSDHAELDPLRKAYTASKTQSSGC